MSEKIKTIKYLKGLLSICDNFLSKKNLLPETEKNLVIHRGELKKRIRALQVSKPIEGLKG